MQMKPHGSSNIPIRSYGWLVLLPLMLMVFGQIMFKMGSAYGGFLNIFVITGYIALLSRSLIWIAVLRHLPLSFAYPVLSLSFVFILLASYYIFQEQLTFFKLTGCVLIIVGVSAISMGMQKGAEK